ncbi:MAG TPA: hypothetical protein VF613_02325 [Longimicrobium sp.]
MSDQETDDERLAAFLDGRLDAGRRQEMLARFTASAEEREALAVTADILRELEEEDAEAAALALGEEGHDAGVIPLHTRRPAPGTEVRPARARIIRWIALAAVLAGVALVAGRALQDRGSVAGEPVRLAARLEHADEGLPAGWTERRPWTSVRGEGSAPTAGEQRARSARAGAMLVDLSVAAQARDTAATRVLATQLAARFDPRGGRTGALRRIADGAGGDPERLRPLIGEATERIAGGLDADALRLGAWTEAAGLAAARRDAAFFRDRATRRTLDQAGRLTQADPAANAALQRVRLLAPADPPRWDALAPAIDALAREIATE